MDIFLLKNPKKLVKITERTIDALTAEKTLHPFKTFF